MTKKEFIKRAMQLRPTAKQWRELVERVVNYNGIVKYAGMEDSYRDVHPLVGAIHEHYVKYHIDGSLNPHTRRNARKMANLYHCVI